MLNILTQLSSVFKDKRIHLSNLLVVKRIQQLLIKNQIKIIHSLPGRIRLKSPLWLNNTNNMRRLVEELQKEPKILSVSYTKETGSLLILFDNTPLDDYSQIEQWLKKAEMITHQLIMEGGKK
jgi:hypothetical protein